MSEVVHDASAILAFSQAEPGADVVAAALSDGLMSAVNLAEVVSKLISRGLTEEAAGAAVARLNCAVVPLQKSDAIKAGILHSRVRKRGVSLADSACLSLAASRGLPVLTGDRAWADLGLDVEIKLIR